MTILDPDVAAASASLVAAHKRVVKAKNRTINDLQARNGELQRALQEKAGEVVRAKMQAVDALDEAIAAHEVQPRPLTPDAITDEMVERVQQWAVGLRIGGIVYLGTEEAVREMFTVALTEPPARPEGAVILAARLDEAHKGGGDVQDEADRLYAMGVRVVTEEDPR